MRASADRPRLLFTGGGGAASEALHRLLGERYDVHFADADADAKPASVPPRAWHRVPFASSPLFVSELGRLCRDLDVDILVPGVDEELLPISRAGTTAIAPVVLLPPAGFVEDHLDKLTSNTLLKALGVPVPETATLAEHGRVGFPCVVKPRRGRGSRDVAIVQSEEELRAHVVLCRRPAEDFILQERLQGQEYTVTMVADRDRALRAVVPVRVALKRGITLRAETDRDDAVMAACAALHRAQPVAGCFNIQLVKSDAGDVKPFEINPRISTTACLALAAGVDFVDLYLGGTPPKLGPGGLAAFQDHLRLKRSWRNEFTADGPLVDGS
jgi:carbamoyl-phosphate synthase large subunit